MVVSGFYYYTQQIWYNEIRNTQILVFSINRFFIYSQILNKIISYEIGKKSITTTEVLLLITKMYFINDEIQVYFILLQNINSFIKIC